MSVNLLDLLFHPLTILAIGIVTVVGMILVLRLNAFLALITAAPAAQAPRKANWLTDGGDTQRTSWQRHETLLSPSSVKHMRLVWKLQLDNEPRQLHNLFPPLVVSDVATAGGPAARERRLCEADVGARL